VPPHPVSASTRLSTLVVVVVARSTQVMRSNIYFNGLQAISSRSKLLAILRLINLYPAPQSYMPLFISI